MLGTMWLVLLKIWGPLLMRLKDLPRDFADARHDHSSTYLHAHTHIHAYTGAYMHTLQYIHTLPCMRTDMQTYWHTYIHARIHTCVALRYIISNCVTPRYITAHSQSYYITVDYVCVHACKAVHHEPQYEKSLNCHVAVLNEDLPADNQASAVGANYSEFVKGCPYSIKVVMMCCRYGAGGLLVSHLAIR